MDVTVREERGCLVAAVKGRLDTVNAGDFDRTMGGLVLGGPQKIILELSGLEYISSAGLRSVLAFSKTVKGAGGDMALCGLAGLPREIFLMSRFDTIFTLHVSVEDAAKRF